MERPVLVTFATRYGSTAITAEAVAESLRNSGFAVEIRPVNEVTSVEPYGAVILGAALYIGRLHKDARRFLGAHRDALAKIPVALFVPGPVETREKDWRSGQQQVEKELARYPWFKPVATKVVGGTFDPRRLGFPWKLLPALRKMPVSDARDWDALRAWATELATTLKPGQPRTLGEHAESVLRHEANDRSYSVPKTG